MTFFRFFVFNLIGNVLPILAALAAVPAIAHYAGVERLGALGVVWGLIGTFGFLDFGLSRVVTRRVALAVEQNRKDEEWIELRGFFWWWAMPGLVVITALLVGSQFAFARYFSDGLIGLEVKRGWIWIALCIPITLVTNWLRGALEGLQRFARVSALRTVFGTWNYVAPALIVLVAPTLNAMIAIIMLGRLFAMFAHAWACLQVEPGILVGPAPRRWSSCRMFFQEGGWITISNLVSPLMVYSDRFVLAALVPAEAIAWYTTSQDVMLRMLIIPGALVGVLFPKFSGGAESANELTVIALYQRSIRVISAMMLPICTLAVVLAYDALRLWLGESFAVHSYRVIEIVAIGIFVNSIANFPLAWLQGLGRSHIPARIHMIQVPLYALGLYFSIKLAGIEGAAWIWTTRVTLDCLLLLLLSDKDGRRSSVSTAAIGASFIMSAGFMTSPVRDWFWRAGLVALASVLSLSMAWFGLLNREDRNQIGRLRHAN